MGSKLTASGTERVYAAARLWVDRALRTDDSLFTPGKPIWSKQVLMEIHKRFSDNPDQSGDSFLEKLQRQLEGSPAEVYQLMAEALYFYFLIVSTKDSANEQKTINEVLSWSPAPVEIPSDLIAGLTPGIAKPGPFFDIQRSFQIAFLFEFTEQLKEQEPAGQNRILGDPWSFKDFVMRLKLESAMMQEFPDSPVAQREALFHLVFPDDFEAITNTGHKTRIAKAFSTLVAQPTEDVDHQLKQIRSRLEARHGRMDYLFHEHAEIRVQWDDDFKPWVEFVKRARRYVDSGRLEIEEIGYKVKIAGKLKLAREAVLAGDDGWQDLVGRGIAGNLIHNVTQAKFRDWINGSPDGALNALRAIWALDDSSVSRRIDAFSSQLPQSEIGGAGTRLTVASVLLMGLDVGQYPPFMTTVFEEAYDRTGYSRPERRADEAALYERALGFLDRLIKEAEARGLKLRHRLDAQSVVWALREPEPPPPPPPDPWSLESIESLAGDLLWDPDYLENIIHGLQDKRQAIFQGPPGTGKTYVAKRIAEHCREHGGDFRIVQFHPSYSYEDFVEGFRPKLTGDQVAFELRKGPLRSIAEDAAANSDATFILVIDEINRGNVAKVLGELYFLLEYRDEKVNLQYSSDAFSLPANLWFIGTMNTTDRSIALVDAALRRRFYFFNFFPDEPPIEGLLHRWLDKNKTELKWVADLVDSANGKLKGRHMAIGPSHFMKADLDEKRAQFIWEQAVIPYIEEQFFGDEEGLKKFAYDQVRQKPDGEVQREAGDGDAQA